MCNEVAEHRTSKHKTCRRYDDVGHAHSLTFTCFNGQPLLSRDRTRHWMIEAIELARTKHGFDIWAYVLMPEHVHLLVYPPDADYSISKILMTLKQPVSKRARLFVTEHAPSFLNRMTDVQPNGKRTVRFWQRGGGYDRNLWSPKHIWETIDYIHRNPIRRELCDHPTEWEWSSARSYEDRANRLLPIGFDTLPDDPRQQR